MQTIVILIAALAVTQWSCSEASLIGGSGRIGRASDRGGDDGVDSNDRVDLANGGKDAGDSDGNDGSDHGSLGGEDSNGDGGADADDDQAGGGLIGEECLVATKPSPSSPLGLVEGTSWKASGSMATFNQVMSPPMVGRLIGKTPSILAVGFSGGAYIGAAKVFAIDGKSGAQQWVAEPDVFPRAAPALGDLDGDGKNEVVAAGHGTSLIGLNGQTGKVLWTTQVAYGETIGPSLADLDGDGDVEVIGGGTVVAGATGKVRFQLDISPGTEAVAGDFDRDEEGLELASGEGMLSGSTGKKLCAFDERIFYIAVGRLKESDKDFTVLGRTRGTEGPETPTQIVAYNARTCNKVFARDFPGAGGGPINLADLDGDGDLEIGSAGRLAYVTFRADGEVLWQAPTQDLSSAATGSTAFDFNGDGAVEVVYNDEVHLRVFDGRTGRVLYTTPNSTGTLIEYPVVADVDGDGHADIVVGANNYALGSHYGVRTFRAPDNDWVGTRPIWNQQSYHVTHIADDGRVTGFSPGSTWKKWVKAPHLVGFRSNVSRRAVKPSCR